METKTERMTHACDLCDRWFNTLRGMRIHRADHNPLVKERRSRASKEVHARFDVKVRRTAKLRQTNKRPETKERRSLAARKALSTQSARVNMRCASVLNKEKRVVALRAYFALPGVHELHVERMKQVAAKPEVRARMVAANTNTDVLARKSMKMSEHYINGRMRHARGQCGIYKSFKAGDVWCRSSFERRAFQKLDADERVSSYEVEALRIPYEFRGVQHNYIPDAIVTMVDGSRLLLEVKPVYALSDEKVKAKHAAAVEFCGCNAMAFLCWTEKELFQ